MPETLTPIDLSVLARALASALLVRIMTVRESEDADADLLPVLKDMCLRMSGAILL